MMRALALFVLVLLVPTRGVTEAIAKKESESHATASAQACRVDLDRDARDDLAVFLPTNSEHQLVALISKQSGYQAHVIFQGESSLVLACRVGASIVETTAARREGKRYETGGTYLLLSQPEGGSIGFYWTGSKFQEVQLAD